MFTSLAQLLKNIISQCSRFQAQVNMCCQRPPALYLFQAHPLFSQQPPPPEERFEPLPLLPQPAVKLYLHIISSGKTLKYRQYIGNL